MSETMMLLRHGTKVELPIGAVIAAAKADIARYARWKDEDSGAKQGGVWEGELRRYAFLPQHIRKARTPAELLLIAAQAPKVSEKTTVRNRAMIYQNPDLLVDAAEALLQ